MCTERRTGLTTVLRTPFRSDLLAPTRLASPDSASAPPTSGAPHRGDALNVEVVRELGVHIGQVWGDVASLARFGEQENSRAPLI